MICSDRTGSKLKHLRDSCLPQEGAVHAGTGRRGRRYLSILASRFFRRDGRRNPAQCASFGKRNPSSAPLFARATPIAPTKKSLRSLKRARLPHRGPSPPYNLSRRTNKPVKSRRWRCLPAGIRDRPASILRRRTTLISTNCRRRRLLGHHGGRRVAAPSKLVLAAQRALVQLGFVPKTPMAWREQQRGKAIERYERDHGLPVRGALSRAIMRKLSAETGITIN